MFLSTLTTVICAIARHLRLARAVPLGIALIGSSLLVSNAAAATPRPKLATERFTSAGNLETALALAKTRNVPLFIVFYTEVEPGCQEMEPVYHDDDFVKATEKMVVAIASPDDHGGSTECMHFPGAACKDHIANFGDVLHKYFIGESSVRIPQHLVIAPDGSLIARREDVATKAQLLELLKGGTDYVANPKSAIEGQKKRIAERLTKLGSHTCDAKAAAVEVLRSLETVYAGGTMECVSKASPKSKLALIPQLSESKQQADRVFSLLLQDKDKSVRDAAAKAVVDFPVICSEARKQLRAVASKG